MRLDDMMIFLCGTLGHGSVNAERRAAAASA